MQSRAATTWRGDLLAGSGETTLASGAAGPLPVTWASRTEAPDGRTSPEELIAAAHASCFSMALSAGLGRAGTPPEQLDTEAVATFTKLDDGWTLTTMALTVRGSVPGIDQGDFAEAAKGASVNCPVSRAIAGNVEITIEATLV